MDEQARRNVDGPGSRGDFFDDGDAKAKVAHRSGQDARRRRAHDCLRPGALRVEGETERDGEASDAPERRTMRFFE
jgi:hypothetical protein